MDYGSVVGAPLKTNGNEHDNEASLGAQSNHAKRDGKLMLTRLEEDRLFDPAKDYEDASSIMRAWIRIGALITTMILECLPAFVISEGHKHLANIMTAEEIGIFVGFATVVSAVAGNVGLQACSGTTRAISHHYVERSNWRSYMLKEMRVSLIISLVLCSLLFGAVMIGMKIKAGNFNPEAAMVLAFSQFATIISAQFTGIGGPVLFKIYLKKDPAGWAGPFETSFQDLVGTFFNFVLGNYLFEFFWALFHWNETFVGPNLT
mmetsp:Transcript_16586/g.24196  ORF Transcript_16586/g.24196 Transcript_16586/m.24196 type:complete len:262 (+) Transcript_16586:43-828(+)